MLQSTLSKLSMWKVHVFLKKIKQVWFGEEINLLGCMVLQYNEFDTSF